MLRLGAGVPWEERTPEISKALKRVMMGRAPARLSSLLSRGLAGAPAGGLRTLFSVKP